MIVTANMNLTRFFFFWLVARNCEKAAKDLVLIC